MIGSEWLVLQYWLNHSPGTKAAPVIIGWNLLSRAKQCIVKGIWSVGRQGLDALCDGANYRGNSLLPGAAEESLAILFAIQTFMSMRGLDKSHCNSSKSFRLYGAHAFFANVETCKSLQPYTRLIILLFSSTGWLTSFSLTAGMAICTTDWGRGKYMFNQLSFKS